MTPSDPVMLAAAQDGFLAGCHKELGSCPYYATSSLANAWHAGKFMAGLGMVQPISARSARGHNVWINNILYSVIYLDIAKKWIWQLTRNANDELKIFSLRSRFHCVLYFLGLAWR